MPTKLILKCSVSKSDQWDCQDACAAEPSLGRFAIADGVSAATFVPGAFAKRLVDSFVSLPNEVLDEVFRRQPDDGGEPYAKGLCSPAAPVPAGNSRLEGWSARLRTQWRADVDEVHRHRADKLTMKQFENGDIKSEATFAGVRIHEVVGGKCVIEVLVVGDCYVFIYDEKDGCRTITAADLAGEKRDNTVAVTADKNAVRFPAYRRAYITANPGTYVLLATDCIGWWLHKTGRERGDWKDKIEFIVNLKTQSEFTNWVLHLRNSGDLGQESDDVTLMLLELDGPASVTECSEVVSPLAAPEARTIAPDHVTGRISPRSEEEEPPIKLYRQFRELFPDKEVEMTRFTWGSDGSVTLEFSPRLEGRALPPVGKTQQPVSATRPSAQLQREQPDDKIYRQSPGRMVWVVSFLCWPFRVLRGTASQRKLDRPPRR
jgi:hypothetical protein